MTILDSDEILEVKFTRNEVLRRRREEKGKKKKKNKKVERKGKKNPREGLSLTR